MLLASTVLSYDHGFIQQVVDLLPDAAERPDADWQGLAGVVEYLEKFMDAFHHGKEERFLFPAALAADPSMDSAVKKLVAEHEHARDLLRRIRAELREGGDRAACAARGRELAAHMSAHIEYEERTFFPAVGQVLTPEQDRKVTVESDRFTVMIFYKFCEGFADRLQDEVLGPGYYGQKAAEESKE